MSKSNKNTVIVMAIKPKYAKAIYAGKKNWEFRKVPPPLFKTIYLYESAPVSAITGVVVFGVAVTGVPLAVWEIARKNSCFTKNLTGISFPDLEKYAGDKPVTALRVTDAAQFNVSFDGKPPLNWSRFTKVSRAPAANPAESEVKKND